MCSIGGFISKEPLSSAVALRLARALLWYGVGRGRQSAGVYVNGKVLKRAQDPEAFIDREDLAPLFDTPPSLCLVHTRQPTSGGTGDEQAHPFHVGNVVTVHNGWIHDTDKVKKQWGLEKPSGVDSELVPAYIAKYGVEALPEFFKTLSGNSAIATVLNDKDLYFMRDGNPLEYVRVFNSKNTVMVFGSTQDQVLSAARHCWLMPSCMSTITLPNGILFKATHDAVEQLTEPLRRVTQYSTPHGRGPSSSAHYHQSRASTPAHTTRPTTPAVTPAPVQTHDNPRDAMAQKLLGPNFYKTIVAGRKTWVYVPPTKAAEVTPAPVVTAAIATAVAAAADKEIAVGEKQKKLSRRERRRLAKEQREATAGATSSEHGSGGGAGSRD